MKIKGLKSGEFKILNDSPSLIYSKNFIIKYKSKTDKSSLSIIIKKRYFKSAVKRNYLRRVIKNIFFEFFKNVDKNYTILIILKRKIDLNFSFIERELHEKFIKSI